MHKNFKSTKLHFKLQGDSSNRFRRGAQGNFEDCTCALMFLHLHFFFHLAGNFIQGCTHFRKQGRMVPGATGVKGLAQGPNGDIALPYTGFQWVTFWLQDRCQRWVGMLFGMLAYFLYYRPVNYNLKIFQGKCKAFITVAEKKLSVETKGTFVLL